MEHFDEDTSDHSDLSNGFANLPSDSPGSSVSTRLKDEYDELLKYAVVVPTYDPTTLTRSLADFRGSFPQGPGQIEENNSAKISDGDDSGTEVGDSVSHTADSLPDTATRPDTFQSTPIQSKKTHSKTKGQDENSDDSVDAPVPGTSRETAFQNQFEKESQLYNNSAHPPNNGIDGEQYAYGFSVTVDQDVSRMEGLMNTWLGDLNRNVLAEFGQSKLRMLEHYKHQLHKEKERHAAETNRMQNEMESLKELLMTYEQSIERKDEVINNLTRAMQKQRDKFEMAKTFCEWKIRHNDSKREAFASNLAYRHYQRTLSQKVWRAWHSLIESKWRQRVEKACQAKAQEVCIQLTNDYETRIASANEALEAARNEVSRLHTERERYEETMKKAFMRGVCALNLEAMTMFNESEDQSKPGEDAGHSGSMGGSQEGRLADQERLGLPQTFPQEAVFTSEPPGAPSPRIITSQGSTSSRSTLSQASSRCMTNVSAKPKQPIHKGKTVSAKISARADSGSKSSLGGTISQGLAPPMSSVIVERHQPVVKATVGQAKASKYPRSTGCTEVPPGGIVHRKIAGQTKMPLSNQNIQTVKMVD